MKSKKRLILLIALVCIAAASLIAGCKIGPQSYKEFLDKNELKSMVTYYSNGGNFSAERSEITLYFKEGDPLINVDTTGYADITFERAGYVFEGWYYVQLDEDGKPRYAEGSTTTVLIDESRTVNLASLKAVADEHLYVGAKWTVDVRIELVLASENDVTLDDRTTVVKKGGTIGYVSFGIGNSVTLYNNSAPTTSDSTFLAFYTDAEMKNPLTDSVQKPTDGKDVKIYVEYLSGKWTLVKTATDVASMFAGAGSSSNRYYIFNDINCENTSVNMGGNNFACTIEGNGHTISNLSFSATRISNGSNSMLGNIKSTAKILNLTLENVSVSFKLHSSGIPSLYMLFQSIEEGATFKDFNISGIEESITYNRTTSCFIANIQLIGESYETSNWKYGGFESDSDFVHDGITVTGASLTINDEKIVNEEVI